MDKQEVTTVSLKSFLIQFKSNLLMISTIIISVVLIFFIEGIGKDSLQSMTTPFGEKFPIPRQGDLTIEEKKWATTAWKYFEQNYVPETGLVNPVKGFPVTTLWDMGTSLFGTLCAYKLEIITQDIFEERISKALKSIQSFPLFEGKLPNKSYNTQTLKPVTISDPWNEQPTGFSVLDVSRLVVSLYALGWHYPKFMPEIKNILKNWDLNLLVREGILHGVTYRHEERTSFQEGRLGYEQYAARCLNLFGIDAVISNRNELNLEFKNVQGIDVPVDSRNAKTHVAQNYTLSEPFILEGIELGWNLISKHYAYRVYRAQEERYKSTGILTCVSEDHIDRGPKFVYNAVVANRKAWHAITEDGIDADDYKTLSSKAAVAWFMLFNTPYTQKLVEEASKTLNETEGWVSGIYEKNGEINAELAVNTNGIILEALFFKKYGPIIQGIFSPI